MNNTNEQQYLDLLEELVLIHDNEPIRSDRTGTGTSSVFGRMLNIDLTDNKIPLMTTKKVRYQDAIDEMIWMYVMGNPDTSFLDEKGIKIWKEWAQPMGNTSTIGKMYGQVLLDFDGINQVQRAIDLLKTNPTSRRALFTTLDPRAVADENKTFAENVALGNGVLNACHGVITQLYLNAKGKLEMFTYTRSNDMFLGCPYNLVAYSVLAHVIARELGTEAERLVYTIGDAHLYKNTVEQARVQLSRDPYECPRIELDESVKTLKDLRDSSQVEVVGYQCHGFLKAAVAV